MKSRIFNIIVAAGSGRRFGTSLPKQFCRIDGTPVLVTTLSRMSAIFKDPSLSSRYEPVNIIVLSENYFDFWHELCLEFPTPSHTVVNGGTTRWESVKKAIDYITATYAIEPNCDIITVHDGARPIIDRHLIADVLEGIGDGDGCIPAIPVVDSLRRVDPVTGASEPIDRSSIRAVQTPQAFIGSKLADAYHLPYRTEFTDDASVMAVAGYGDIRLSEGNAHNIKITLPSDLEIASIYLRHEQATKH